MIKTWKHKGLKLFFATGSTAGINAAQASKIKRRLEVINKARSVEEINIPGFKLHKLKGERDETYSICVTGNWRITFQFFSGDAYILDYEDYH